MSKSGTHTSRKNLALLASVPIALVASGAMVWHASYSAFTATTSNPASNWAAGTVALVDDDADTALFSSTNLKPGATGQKCIKVTSNGSLASTVKLYGTSYTNSNGLGANLNLQVEEGTGGSSASCTGFAGSSVFNGTLAAFSAKSGFATGVGSWAPTGTAAESKVYRITYTLAAATPDSAQGGTAQIGFTWESQNS